MNLKIRKNKNRFMIILKIIIVIFILGGSFYLYSGHQNNYVESNQEFKVVDDYGTWRLTFDKGDIVEKTPKIKVYDSQMNQVPIIVKKSRKDRNTFVVSPKLEYEAGNTYKLVIDKDSYNNKINNSFVKSFKINMKPLKVINFEIIDDKYDMRIGFNQAIDVNKKLYDYVKLLNSEDRPMDIKVKKVSHDRKTIELEIEEDLIPKETYTLRVRGNLFSSAGNIMKDTFIRDFKVEKIRLDESLGLGKYQSLKQSIERDYKWYTSQNTITEEGINNSGPAVAVMAAKWISQDEDINIDRAREIYYPGGDEWFIVTLKSFFNEFSIKADIKEEIDSKAIRDAIDQDKIVITYIDPEYIQYQESNRAVVGRFMKETIPHYILIKGYVIVDDKLYFQVYDPYNMNYKYIDGSFKGMDRYYEETNLVESIKNSWDKIVVISE